ncbi:hypothetical protein BJV77DRAFT_986132 [Russula vinacea]|nr:hypothetical protein BJV77DRAFT_986132 [Russula vinacea]
MPFARLLRRFSQPTLARSIPTDAGAALLTTPTYPAVFLTDVVVVPSPEIVPAINPEDPKFANTSRKLDTAGDEVATTQSNVAPFIPTVTATVAVAAQSEVFRGMPVLMNALDELKAVHPIIGARASIRQMRNLDNRKNLRNSSDTYTLMSVMRPLSNCQPEQKLLSDLINAKGGKLRAKHQVTQRRGHRTHQANPGDADLELHLRETLEDPSAAAEKNWGILPQFEAQKHQIIDELTLVVQRESDRVVQELKGKAHERIRDRGSPWLARECQARHFVLALRDYYLEKLASEANGVLGMASYIDVMWVQPILEASMMTHQVHHCCGVNRLRVLGQLEVSVSLFFLAVPSDDRSLPHWLAFWANDRNLLLRWRRRMCSPSQSEAVDEYFGYVWNDVHTLTAAVLRNYVIDEVDTLPLIAGVGRIEKEGAQGIIYIQGAISYQNFSQQRLDPEKQFETFAFGIFKYYHNRNALWTVDYVRRLSSPIISYNDDNEDQKVQPGDVLNHGHKDELSLDYSVYDGHSTDHIPNCGDVDPPMKDMYALGSWNGYFYGLKGVRWNVHSMMTFVLADLWSLNGRQTIAGSWSKGEDDAMQINFKFKLSFHHDALTGVWGRSAKLESSMGIMELRRILPRYLTVYPSIKELRDNKPRALWKFAIAAVRDDIRREHWTWSYFSQRRDDRKTIVSLLVRSRWFGTPLNAEETATLREITRRLTPNDACFYDSMVEHIRAFTCVHDDADCDSCDGRIGGPRLFCLDCAIKSTDPLDLCCAPQCVPHEPSHRLVKVRINVLSRNHGRAYSAACDAFERVEETCRKVAEFCSRPNDETGPDEQRCSSVGPTSTEMPAKKDKPDDAEVEDKTARDSRQDQGRLSFPFWYCIFCKDDLYICNGCDAEGHTEDHHLIRCLAPEKNDDDDKDKGFPTEQRLTSMEGRLDGMQTQLDDLSHLLLRLVGATEAPAA